MFKVNKKIEYALMALKHLNAMRPGQLTSAKEICETYGAPFDVISRSLQKLGRKEWVLSVKGSNGGYQLAKDLSKVSFRELLELILGEVHIASCLEGNHCGCDITSTCNIISPMLILNQKLINFLNTISILELISTEKSGANSIKMDYLRNTSTQNKVLQV